MAKGKPANSKKSAADQVIDNRRARYDYAVLDTVECGMVLRGSEVKSIRDGKMSLAEGYVRIEWGRLKGAAPRGRESGKEPAKGGKPAPRRSYEPGLYLHGVNIAEYAPAGPTGSSGQHKPTRVRTLLANRRELERLAKEVEVKGCTLVPLKVYFKNGLAKILIGIAKSKTQKDKRESITKRDAQRDIQRAMSKRM